MRPYEVMVILDVGLEEDDIRAVLDQASSLLTAKGATIGRTDRWGRRRFAYELKHRWEGYYILLEVTGEPAAMADLDRMLFLADNVLRHKIVRMPEGTRRAVNAAAVPDLDAAAAEAS